MKEYIRTINKYVILLIIETLFSMFGIYISFRLFGVSDFENIRVVPVLVDYLIRLVIIVLLIFDSMKYKLKYTFVSCVAALFYPLLGIVVFSVLMISKQTKEV